MDLFKTRITALITMIIFALSNTAHGYMPSVTPSSNTPIVLDIPQSIGKIEKTSYIENTPLVVHIQSAHGNYEAQQHIQEILNLLNQNYGFDLILLEGGIGRLNPKRLDLYPNEPERSLKIADYLMKKAELTGPEKFLVENMFRHAERNVLAFGVEDVRLYKKNRESFQQAIIQRPETEFYLKVERQKLDQLISKKANPELRHFLKKLEDFENSRSEVFIFFRELKNMAHRSLGIDLNNMNSQTEFPMLTRLERLNNLKTKLNNSKIGSEKQAFLSELESRGILFQYPDKNIRFEFEKLMELLPSSLSFESYPNFCLHVQSQILREELDAFCLFKEIEIICGQITDSLAQTESEKRIIKAVYHLKLLEKLFELNLTRNEFASLVTISNKIRPQYRNVGKLFDIAVKFYQQATQREATMFENILERMKQTGRERAILVTGGFHAEGMESLAKSNKISYVRVNPRINSIQNNHEYIRAMQESHIEAILKLQSDRDIRAQGGSPDYLRGQIREAIAASLGDDLPKRPPKFTPLPPPPPPLPNFAPLPTSSGLSKQRPTKDSSPVEENDPDRKDVAKRITYPHTLEKEIAFVEFSPHSENLLFIAFGDKDFHRRASILNINTGEQFDIPLPRGTSKVVSVIFSNDERFIIVNVVIGAHGKAQLYDLKARKIVSLPQAFEKAFEAKMSPSGKYAIFSFREDGEGTEKLFDLRYQSEAINGHLKIDHQVNGIYFSPDEKIVILKYRSGSSSVIDFEKNLPQGLKLSGNLIHIVSFTKDGKYVIARYKNPSSEEIYDIHSKSSIGITSPSDLHFSADDQYVVAEGHFTNNVDTPVKIFNLRFRQPVIENMMHGAFGHVASPNGKIVVLKYRNESTKIIDLTSESVLRIEIGPDVSRVVFSPDSRYLGVLSYISKNDIGIIAKIYDLKSKSQVNIEIKPRVDNLFFSPDGRFVYFVYGEAMHELVPRNRVVVFDLKSGQNIEHLIGKDVQYIKFSKAGNFAFLRYADGSTRIVTFKESLLEKFKSSSFKQQAQNLWKTHYELGFNILSRLINDGDIDSNEQLVAFIQIFAILVKGKETRTQLSQKIFDISLWKLLFHKFRQGNFTLPLNSKTAGQIQIAFNGTGSSLGQSIKNDIEYSKLQRYSRLRRLAEPEVVFTTTRHLAGDFFYLPDAPEILNSYLRILRYGPKPAQIDPAVEAFSQDDDLKIFMKYLQKTETVKQAVPMIFHERILRNKPEVSAKLIAETENPQDLLIAVLTDRNIPRIISHLFKLSNDRKFRVRTVQEDLLSVSKISELTRGYQISPVAVSSYEDGLDIQLAKGDRIKLKLKALAAKGIDPVKVLALIRKISDEPDKRKALFLQAGFEFHQTQGFWEVGDSFAERLADIYNAYNASRLSAQSA